MELNQWNWLRWSGCTGPVKPDQHKWISLTGLTQLDQSNQAIKIYNSSPFPPGGLKYTSNLAQWPQDWKTFSTLFILYAAQVSC